ncbi:unnamed protein product [Acanthoscelides obtectus]|uniref:Uncharacterized protein n=2 Tax=Acanthoscelides obtectus TaxID=200917 RepID=A0A9P0MJK2_ACAOB|nr:unnamed protein product [Acanthoscelides obtectus]CAK1667986.1 Ribonuclease H2 subunit C [Acanthoscelides obtectus]
MATIHIHPKAQFAKKNSKLQSMPFKVHADCDANVEQYFNSYVKTTKDNYFKSSFRGYPLLGKEVPVPDGYVGLVLHESIKPITEKEERKLRITNTFSNITFWNWDKVPSKNDSIIKALEWIEIAEVLHSPIVEE